MSIYLENSARYSKNRPLGPNIYSRKIAKILKIIHFLIKSELIKIQKWLSTLSPLEKGAGHDLKVSKVIQGR